MAASFVLLGALAGGDGSGQRAVPRLLRRVVWRRRPGGSHPRRKQGPPCPAPHNCNVDMELACRDRAPESGTFDILRGKARVLAVCSDDVLAQSCVVFDFRELRLTAPLAGRGVAGVCAAMCAGPQRLGPYSPNPGPPHPRPPSAAQNGPKRRLFRDVGADSAAESAR